ncbi:MAG TPA: TolC family protein [bacterium]|nr:TolC family protein [bacterium]HPR89259.1 TolC family protein [bacterium]
MPEKKRIVAVLFILVMSLHGWAQEQPFPPDSALATALHHLRGKPLLLQQAIEMALANATDLQQAAAGYRAATGARRSERGSFDPEFYVQFTRENQHLPSASFFTGAPVLKTQQNTGSSGVRWLLPTGTAIDLSLNSNRLRTNSGFAFLNPENVLFGNLTVRQPILGGFAASGRKNLEQAEHRLDAALAGLDQKTLDVAAAAEQLYWDLYQAERDLAVQQLSLNQAEALLKEASLRAQSGLIGPVQVASAKTFLTQQQLQLLDRDEQCTRASEQLAVLLGHRPGEGEERFLTLDEPPDEFPLPDVEQLVHAALDHSLALKALSAEIAARQTMVQAAAWEQLPQLDLLGSLGGNGLSGAPNDVVFLGDTLRSSIRGSFNHAVTQALHRDYPAWMVGVSLSMPIGLRHGQGEEQRLQGEADQAQQIRVAAARALEDLVRANHRELATGKHRLYVAELGVQAAQEQVRIGMTEFRNGRSTTFELVRLAADLAAAQQRYSEAMVRRAKAAALLISLTSGAFPGGEKSNEN